MKKVVALLPALLLLSSCGLIYSIFGPPRIYFEWVGTDSGQTRFETTDEAALGSFIFAPAAGSASADLVEVKATVSLTSGSADAPFGIVFCYTAEDSFYTLLVNTDGEYGVFKVDGTAVTALVEPRGHSALVTGLNQKNEIGVQDEGGGEIAVYINTERVHSFVDSSFTTG